MADRHSVIVLAALFSLVSSVALAQTPSSPAAPQPEKKSSEFQTGYTDGCIHATSGGTRNETLFKTDVSYHSGWIAGFSSCYSHLTINTNGDPNGPLKNIF